MKPHIPLILMALVLSKDNGKKIHVIRLGSEEVRQAQQEGLAHHFREIPPDYRKILLQHFIVMDEKQGLMVIVPPHMVDMISAPSSRNSTAPTVSRGNLRTRKRRPKTPSGVPTVTVLEGPEREKYDRAILDFRKFCVSAKPGETHMVFPIGKVSSAKVYNAMYANAGNRRMLQPHVCLRSLSTDEGTLVAAYSK